MRQPCISRCRILSYDRYGPVLWTCRRCCTPFSVTCFGGSMLDARFVRENMDKVKDALTKRSYDLDLSEFTLLEEERLRMLKESEELRNRRNIASEEIGRLKKNGKSADDLV